LGICRRALAAAIAVSFSLAAEAMQADAQGPLTSVATDVHLEGDPTSVILAPQNSLASALTDTSRAPVVLAVQRIEGTSVQPIRINVFLNMPSADSRTPCDDHNCLGFIQLLPARGTIRPTGYNFELSNVRGLDPRTAMHVTFVPVIGNESRPSQVSLRIGRVYLRQQP
jgi:hypothetical protein